MDGAALDRAGADQRHLHGQVVEVLRAACAAASASAPGSRSGRRRSSRPAGSPRRSPRRRSGSARGRSRSPRTRAISSTQRSTAESIPSPSRSIFRKPASAQESLSHCAICRPSIAAGCTGQMSTSGRVESTIPPGMLGGVARQPPRLARPAGRARASAPSARAPSRSPARCRLGHRLGAVVHVDGARDALDLARGQPEGLAEVAHRPSASGSRRTPPPAPSARRRSARGSAGSAARGCRGGSRGRCRAPR